MKNTFDFNQFLNTPVTAQLDEGSYVATVKNISVNLEKNYVEVVFDVKVDDAVRSVSQRYYGAGVNILVREMSDTMFPGVSFKNVPEMFKQARGKDTEVYISYSESVADGKYAKYTNVSIITKAEMERRAELIKAQEAINESIRYQ